MIDLAAADRPAALAGHVPLFRELGDLKRIRSAQGDGSIATRRFRAAWSALAAGADTVSVMRAVVASCLAASRLGDLDAQVLAALGLGAEEARTVLGRGFDAVAADTPEPLRSELKGALGARLPEGSLPTFVGLLERQPRAGVTCPGRPRIMLEPAENHAEHCLMVAVYGVLLSPGYGADPAVVFLASLAHHLHNASMPDSGFTGEMLLGDALDPVIAAAVETAAADLEPGLRDRVMAARRILPDADAPEGRAFHAADVIDRVLEIDQHLRRTKVDMDLVLDDYELVHAGPVKAFHDRVLAEARLP